MSSTIQVIVEDKAGRVRCLVGGELCRGVLDGRPVDVAVGDVLGLVVQMTGAQRLRLCGRGRVERVGGVIANARTALRPGLMLALDLPSLVRAADGAGPFDDGVADTVKLPTTEFWEGDTAKIPPAAPRPASPRFSSVALSDAVPAEASGPWTDSSSIVR